MSIPDAIIELKSIIEQIKGLEKLKDEQIGDLSKRVDKLINIDDGEIFTLDGLSIGAAETLDFNEIVTSNVAKLEEFKYDEYYEELDKKLGKSKSSDEIEKMALERKAKIDELISKINRMGKLNTVIKEMSERSKKFDIHERLEEKDNETDALYKIEEEKRVALLKFRNDVTVKACISQLNALKNKVKIEEENKEIDDKIAEEEAKRDKVKDTKLKEIHQRKINNLKKQKEENNKKLDELDKEINGKTEAEIIEEMKSRIPDNLDKDAIEKAISGGNPEQGLEDINQGILSQMHVYQNRKSKNSERREQINVGKTERTARTTRTPLVYNADDYSLTDDELADIDGLIEADGDEIKVIREAVKGDMEANPDRYPIPTGKDLKKQVREWLDEKEGKTRNPFKILDRMRRVRFGDAEAQYKEALKSEQIKEEIRARLIDGKKRAKFDEKREKARTESEAKTATLDKIENAFKLSIRKAALAFKDDELSELVKTGDYGRKTSEVLDTVLEDRAKEDDDEFIH